MRGKVPESRPGPPRSCTTTHTFYNRPSEINADGFGASLPAKLIQLDLLYMPTRYPDTLPGTFPDGLPNQPQAKETLDWAQEVLEKVEQFTQP